MPRTPRATRLEAEAVSRDEGSPVWSRDGILAVGNAHKQKVKLTVYHGANLPDPK